MKQLYTNLFCLAALLISVSAFAAAEKPIASTAKFDFYNNYWTNLHHFLYDKALKEPPVLATDSIENQIIKSLKGEDLKNYNEAVDFYRKYLASRNLVSDSIMRTIRYCLINFDDNTVPDCNSLEQAHIEILKKFSPIYKKYFWKIHSAQNIKVLNEHLKILQQTENEIAHQIADLSQTEWTTGKIRVDLSVHASGSGSYNFVSPTIILVSSASPRLAGTQFIEMLFHEASHAIITENGGAIGASINKASSDLGKRAPIYFWHSVLFYIVGKSTQNALAKLGIEHELYMEKWGIGKRYYNTLDQNMEIYMDGKISLYEALRRTISKA